MIDLRLGRYALGICVAVAMLAGCGGHASNGVVPVDGVPNSLANHKSFYYTGAAQDFKVPAGVTQLKVIALGAHGAGNTVTRGGRVHAVIPVTPGETLVVYVGGDASESTGGFNGGGNGGADYGCYNGRKCTAYGGGGASDVRQGGDGLANRVLVVGGGGGQGGSWSKHSTGGGGGKGGGLTGGSGAEGSGNPSSYNGGGGGDGGTQSAGGSGGEGSICFYRGSPGSDGMLLVGGVGGQSGLPYGSGPGGGGGGGGYYGGGGGGAGSSYQYYCSLNGGGGGGGASYVERSATNVQMLRGFKKSAGNGLVVFGW